MWTPAECQGSARANDDGAGTHHLEEAVPRPSVVSKKLRFRRRKAARLKDGLRPCILMMGGMRSTALTGSAFPPNARLSPVVT